MKKILFFRKNIYSTGNLICSLQIIRDTLGEGRGSRKVLLLRII